MSTLALKRKADADVLVEKAVKRAKHDASLPVLINAVRLFSRVRAPYADYRQIFAVAMVYIPKYKELKADGLESTMQFESDQYVHSQMLAPPLQSCTSTHHHFAGTKRTGPSGSL